MTREERVLANLKRDWKAGHSGAPYRVDDGTNTWGYGDLESAKRARKDGEDIYRAGPRPRKLKV